MNSVRHSRKKWAQVYRFVNFSLGGFAVRNRLFTPTRLSQSAEIGDWASNLELVNGAFTLTILRPNGAQPGVWDTEEARVLDQVADRAFGRCAPTG